MVYRSPPKSTKHITVAVATKLAITPTLKASEVYTNNPCTSQYASLNLMVSKEQRTESPFSPTWAPQPEYFDEQFVWSYFYVRI